MANKDPRDHHYVPQFYLRGFASDPGKKKIKTVARNGGFAVFAERSIKNLGFERDFYVFMHNGVPVNVETTINSKVETPLSRTDTWAKIKSLQNDQLDENDRGVLYALIRHLETRNPHGQKISEELSKLSADPNSTIPFTDEEREMYAYYRRHPDELRRVQIFRAVSTPWTERHFRQSTIAIFRSPIPLRTLTIPVLTLSVPDHPAIKLTLPGQTPFQYILTLNRFAFAALVLGDFDGAFSNQEISLEDAKGFNRTCAGYFAHFSHVRHLIADDERIEEDLTWARFDLVHKEFGHMKFKRRATAPTGDSGRPA